MDRAHEEEYVEFVSARMASLRQAAYLLCGDPQRADDLSQNTLTKLYLKWNRARVAVNRDGYLHRMLVRTFIDERRLAWSRVRLTPRPPERAAKPEVDIETRDVVLRALEQVPKGQRAMLVMRFLCDLPVEDVAKAMRCSPSNVKSQTARGLATLRQVLEKAGVSASASGHRISVNVTGDSHA
ncbi:SigE family RNA polymerase sigma factor [Plantactinospora sp. GCM10030261]|uniref:SigE family RNA polymerase sigma factor n=1 Tax=Plantactinospora sp. GCM10030261 TaxID=3273420 RepID=UPI003607A5D2